MNLGSGKRCQIEALYTYTGKSSCDGWRGISLEECQVKCDKNEVHNFSYPMIHNSYFFSSLRMFLFLSCFYIFISWISLYFVTSSDFFIIIALRRYQTSRVHDRRYIVLMSITIRTGDVIWQMIRAGQQMELQNILSIKSQV